MTIDIKRSAATILSPAIDQGTPLHKSLNGDEYINAVFSLDSFTEILIGDYITFRGATYTVRQTPDIKKVSEAEYQYTVRFDGPRYLLEDAMYLMDGDMEFYLTGTAEDFIDLIVENMNRVFGTGEYLTGSVTSTDFKVLHFNGENCLKVLQRICQEFELEYYLSGDPVSINLSEAIGSATGLEFEYKSGLYNIKRTKVQNKNVITRLYPFGSEKNLGPDYTDRRTRTPLGSKLRLKYSTHPDNYIEQNVATYGLKEATKEFPDIYPHFTGTVETTSDSQHIIDTSIDFDLNYYLIEGVTAKVVFLSGDLSGYEFEIISFNNSTKEVYFKTYTDEQGGEWPSGLFVPAIGDQFTFVDIKMPPAYISAAEAELLSEATTYLSRASSPSVIYDIEMDWHSLKASATDLDIGDVITIVDSELAPGGVDLRIVELTQQLANVYKYTVKISDDILKNYFAKTSNDRSQLQNSIATTGHTAIARTRTGLNITHDILNGALDDRYYTETESDERFVNVDGDSMTGNLGVDGTITATGAITGGTITSIGSVIADTYFRSSDNAAILGTASAGTVFLRPDAYNSAIAQSTFSTTLATIGTDLDITGDLDVSADVTVGVDIGSPVFSSGFAGSGWQYDDSETRLTIDNLTVRKQMRVYELLIEQIRANRGAIVVSPGNGKILSNVAGTVTVDTGDDDRFPISIVQYDLLRCQRWNGSGIKYYVARVDTVTGDTFTYTIVDGTDDIAAGDEVVVFGNTTNTARQGLLYMTASDDNAPYIDVLDGVTSGTLTDKTKVRLGKLDGITDADFGGALSGYGLYSDNVYLKGAITISSGSGYSNLTDKPAALNDINSTEGTKLTGIADGADVTGDNTAANITGQGALATANDADFATQVTGTEKPANNATVGATWGTNLSNIPPTLEAPAGAGLYLSSTHLGYYDATNWKTYMDSAGNLILGDIAGGNTGLSWSQTAGTLTVKGEITAESGDIGGFSISAADGLYSGTGATRVQMKPGAGFWAGATAIADAPFNVTNAGVLTAKSGSVGGWSIDSDAIYIGTKKVTDGYSTDGVTLDANGAFHSKNFHIDSDGDIGIRAKEIIYAYLIGSATLYSKTGGGDSTAYPLWSAAIHSYTLGSYVAEVGTTVRYSWQWNLNAADPMDVIARTTLYRDGVILDSTTSSVTGDTDTQTSTYNVITYPGEVISLHVQLENKNAGADNIAITYYRILGAHATIKNEVTAT